MECVNLRPADLEYMTDHNMCWQCSLCTAGGRRLRSGSVCNAAITIDSSQSINSYQNHFERLFAELGSIKAMQRSIVDDISYLKQSQAQLSSDLSAKHEKLQKEMELCSLKLDDHEQLLVKHSETLDGVTVRIVQLEQNIESANREGTNDTSAPSAAHVTYSEDEMFVEFSERQRRARNIILFNVGESQGAGLIERKAADLDYVKGVFTFLECDSAIVNVSRVGKFDVRKSRPIKVTLGTEKDVHSIIQNARKLRGSSAYQGVSISFDRTPKQLARYKAVRSELRDREAKGERNLKIRFISGTPKIVSLN